MTTVTRMAALRRQKRRHLRESRAQGAAPETIGNFERFGLAMGGTMPWGRDGSRAKKIMQSSFHCCADLILKC